MKVMFLDESGDHNLTPGKIDLSYPVFVLAGCIFDEKYYRQEVIKKLNALKITYFGSDNIIFHTLEMSRPTKSRESRFLKLINKPFRLNFYRALNTLLENLSFSLVVCAIKKVDHIEKYGLTALDPYLLSFDNLLNRFIFELKFSESGKIIAEKRNSILDNQLELAWLNFKISGTKFIKGSEIKDRVESLYMVPRSKNETGLQIADLVASPIGRKILGIKKKVGHEVNFDMLKGKFSQKDGRILNYGLTILPKK